MKNKRKKIIYAGVVLAITLGLISVFFLPNLNQDLKSELIDTETEISDLTDENEILNEDDDDGLQWYTVGVVTPEMIALGEASPGAGESGWLSTFQFLYSETPGTSLSGNATNGDYGAWGNVSGYTDADDSEIDLESEVGNYFVVRCRFNESVKNGGVFFANRCRVTLNVTGDETISAVTQDGEGSDTTGGGIASRNDSGDEYIWINFWWDDNSDGYRILDDGGLDWEIWIQEKR